MTPDDFAAILAARTPGDWFWNSYSAIYGGEAVGDERDPEFPLVSHLPVRAGDLATIQGEKDAAAIVAAVNLAPLLLDLWRAALDMWLVHTTGEGWTDDGGGPDVRFQKALAALEAAT